MCAAAALLVHVVFTAASEQRLQGRGRYRYALSNRRRRASASVASREEAASYERCIGGRIARAILIWSPFMRNLSRSLLPGRTPVCDGDGEAIRNSDFLLRCQQRNPMYSYDLMYSYELLCFCPELRPLGYSYLSSLFNNTYSFKKQQIYNKVSLSDFLDNNMNNLRFSIWTFRVTNNLDFRELIMRLAQLLPCILMMLFVVDLDKGMSYSTNNDLMTNEQLYTV